MSTEINNTLLKQFIIKNIGLNFDKNDAEKFDIEDEYDELSDELDTYNIELDDLMKDDDIVGQFTALYTKEQEKLAKDKEEEKEEQTKVKNGENKAKA